MLAYRSDFRPARIAPSRQGNHPALAYHSLRRRSAFGTEEPCLSRSPAWPVLNEQETRERGSIAYRMGPYMTLNRRCVSALVASRKALRSSSRWTIAGPRVIGGALLLRGRPAAKDRKSVV